MGESMLLLMEVLALYQYELFDSLGTSIAGPQLSPSFIWIESG